MPRRMSIALLAVALFAVPATATVTVPAGFREIVADAALIVRGHVTDVRGVVVAERGIASIAAIAVESALKGHAAAFVSIRIPGGVVGRVRSEIVGAPKLRIGDRAVFFLKRDRADNLWQPVGLSMGIYRVQAGMPGGLDAVNPPVLAGQTADSGAVVRGDVRRKPMPLPEFESLVQVVIAGSTSPR